MRARRDKRARGFTLLECLLAMALLAAGTALALRHFGGDGGFPGTAAGLKNHLQALADHLRCRESENLWLLIGSREGEDGTAAGELLLAEWDGEGDFIALPHWHCDLGKLGAIVAPGGGPFSSVFPQADYGGAPPIPGHWHRIPAAQLRSGGENFQIVLRMGRGRRKFFRRFFLSHHGTVLSEAL